MTIGRTDDPENPLCGMAFEAASLFGTGSRTPSGPAVMAPHEQAGHMIAIDLPVRLTFLLHPRGRPHMPRRAAPSLNVLSVSPGQAVWTVELDSRMPAACPDCGMVSRSRHSSYLRTIQDLPAKACRLRSERERPDGGAEMPHAIVGSSRSGFHTSRPAWDVEPRAWPALLGSSAIRQEVDRLRD